MSNRRPRGLVACAMIVIAAAVLVAGCGGDKSASKESDTYTIGVNAGLTGYVAVFDQQTVKAVRLAAADMNKAGGIGGKQIKVIVQNNRSEPAQAAVVSSELIDKGIDFLIACGDSDLAIPAGRAAQSAKIPAISPAASTPVYTTAVGDYMFGNMPADNQQATALALYALSQGYKTAYTLSSPDNANLDKVPQYFTEVFEKKGGKVVLHDTFHTGDQDFSAQITKLRSLNPQPDVIETPMYEPEFPAFIRQLRAAGVKSPLIGNDGIDTETLPTLGSPVNGVVFTTGAFPAPGSRTADVYKRYQAKYNEPAIVTAAYGFEVMGVIKEAVKRAGSTDGPAVRDALANLEGFPSVTSALTYKGVANRMPIRDVSLVKIQDGVRHFLRKIELSAEDIPKA